MRLQIDIERKTVRIDENSLLGVNMGDFIRELMELLPNEWQDYKLIQSEETINFPLEKLRIPQTYPSPFTYPSTYPYRPQIWYDSNTTTNGDFFN